ncbi:MAG: hypothetical protein KIT48_04555 [Pseudolabrys sp.]|nr:hypothetical protein [Pseudolabrys sp.]
MTRRFPKEIPHPQVRVFGVPFGELLNQQLVAVLDDEADEDVKDVSRTRNGQRLKRPS